MGYFKHGVVGQEFISGRDSLSSGNNISIDDLDASGKQIQRSYRIHRLYPDELIFRPYDPRGDDPNDLGPVWMQCLPPSPYDKGPPFTDLSTFDLPNR